MYEILRDLPASARVLDLGCDKRSFPASATPARVVRLDREIAFRDPEELAAQGDAACLPFADGSFAAIVSNHSLEHFDDLEGALREIGRVVRRDGSLFISVPDASTFCDKLYRWLSNGGGHVNPFTSSADLAALIERRTGLRHRATRTLHTSLSFLNRRNSSPPFPRRLMLVGGGYEFSLSLIARVSRLLDRSFGLRTSVYGWALWFGEFDGEVDESPRVNVCLRCGSGTRSAALRQNLTGRLIRRYRCPQCGASNPFGEG